jgi:hypothetical protein
MANPTAVVLVQDGGQMFQGVFNRSWTVRATMDVNNLAAAGVETATLTVPGVALGDMVLGVSWGATISGLTVSAYVSAANTVTINIVNSTLAAIDPTATTLRLLIGRPSF